MPRFAVSCVLIKHEGGQIKTAHTLQIIDAATEAEAKGLAVQWGMEQNPHHYLQGVAVLKIE